MDRVRMIYEHESPTQQLFPGVSRACECEAKFHGDGIEQFVDLFRSFLGLVGYARETIDEAIPPRE